MNEKMTYIWRLATFLHANAMVMSGEELAPITSIETIFLQATEPNMKEDVEPTA